MSTIFLAGIGRPVEKHVIHRSTSAFLAPGRIQLSMVTRLRAIGCFDFDLRRRTMVACSTRGLSTGQKCHLAVSMSCTTFPFVTDVSSGTYCRAGGADKDVTQARHSILKSRLQNTERWHSDIVVEQIKKGAFCRKLPSVVICVIERSILWSTNWLESFPVSSKAPWRWFHSY